MMKIKEVIHVIVSIFALLMALVITYMLILKLTGHSPTIDQIVISISGLVGAWMFNTQLKIGEFNEFMDNTKENMKCFKEDMKELKYEVKDLKNIIHNMDKRIMVIEQKILSL